MTYDEAVGLAIRTNRKIRKVTMPEMAEALDLTTSAVSRIENGRTQATIVHLRRVARRLGIDGSSILEEAERFFERSKV
jgi:transcriptional regulator with XRE-family HTH domain